MTTFSKCPECGASPAHIVRAPETVAAAYGATPTPSPGAVLEQLTCTNGHQWSDWDEVEEREED